MVALDRLSRLSSRKVEGIAPSKRSRCECRFLVARGTGVHLAVHAKKGCARQENFKDLIFETLDTLLCPMTSTDEERERNSERATRNFDFSPRGPMSLTNQTETSAALTEMSNAQVQRKYIRSTARRSVLNEKSWSIVGEIRKLSHRALLGRTNFLEHTPS